MLVKDHMTRHPIMIGPKRRAVEARQIMTENKIRHLPVVGDGKRPLGLVTRQRLRIPPEQLGSLNVWEITRFLADLTVERVMVKAADLQTIGPDATLEEAAQRMVEKKIGSLVVVEDDVVTGILTETDLMIALLGMLGSDEPGWRATMRVPDRQGEFAKITSALAGRGWGVMSMSSQRSPRAENSWDVVLRIRGPEKDALEAVLSAIPDQHLVDIRAS